MAADAAFSLGGFSLAGPLGWRTRRREVFTQAPGPLPRIVVLFEPGALNEPVVAYGRHRVYAMTRDVARFLVEAGPVSIAGCPAFKAAMRWKEEGNPMRETVAWVDAGGGDLLVASCVRAGNEDVADFEQLLAGLEMRSTSGARSEPPAPPASAEDAYPMFPMPRQRR